jgi:HNH endonuclease
MSEVKKIPLTQGFVALVSKEDFDFVSQFRWYAAVSRRKDGSIRTVYAIRVVRTVSAIRRSMRTISARRVEVKTTSQFMHRLILGLPSNPRLEVDHIDGNGLNNCRENLRWVTTSQNQRNRRTSSLQQRDRVAAEVRHRQYLENRFREDEVGLAADILGVSAEQVKQDWSENLGI